MSLFFIDCEADGPAPCCGKLTEIGAVTVAKHSFYADLHCTTPDQNKKTFEDFEQWILAFNEKGERATMVSDNPAFDWQWINDGFWKYLGRNPLGFSARRIGDFYAGLTGDWKASTKWKSMRVTKHTHHPVDDAMGNLEAWERMLKGERA